MVQYFNPGDSQSLFDFTDALQELVKKNIEQKEEIDSLDKLIAQCKDALLSLQSKKEQENK